MTLLEATIAMAIMAVLMAAALPILAGVRRTWDARRAGTESVQNVRVLADHLYRHLTAAKSITDVSADAEPSGHIQFTSSDDKAYRYEISGSYVRFGPVGSLEDLAGPVSELRFTCYGLDDLATPTAVVGAIRLIQAQATFPKTGSLGRDRTVTVKAYLRVGAASSGEADPVVVPGVALKDTMTWSGSGSIIDSYHSLQGAYSASKSGSEAVVTTNSTSSSRICMYNGTTLYGDAYVGPGGDPATGIVTWGATITGQRAALTEAVAIPSISKPGEMPGSSGDLQLWGSNKVTITANKHYNNAQLSSSAMIIIGGNVTILLDGDLSMSNSSQIRVLPGYTARLYVKGTIGVWGSSVINETAGCPSAMRIYLLGNKESMQMSSTAKVYAVFQGPASTVSIWNSAEFFGKMKTRSLEGGGKIHVDLDCDFD
jgi:hypothetical protein